MNKNLKKGKIIPNSLIALGNNNKSRNTLPLQTPQAKKAKTDDLNPKILINSIEQTIKQESGTSETALNNFITAFKTTLIFSNKPIKTYLSQFLVLFAICKKFPSLFTKPSVVDCLVSVLCYNGKELSGTTAGLSSSYKPQSSMANPTVAGKIKPLHIAICNILLASWKDTKTWPIPLIKAYLDDSFGDRVWVDLPECYLFVQNVETAFPSPGIDPRGFFPLSALSEAMLEVLAAFEGAPSVAMEAIDHSDMRSCAMFSKVMSGLSADDCCRARFDACKPQVELAVAAWLKDIGDRRFMADTQSRPIIRAFCALAGVPEVRAAAVAKSDNWLSTGKLQASTLHMLAVMAASCSPNIIHNAHDINFCSSLMFRFKYKLLKPPVQTALLECLRKVVELHPANLRAVLEIYISNEIYGCPTIPPGAGNTLVPIAYSPQNKSGPVSVSFPAVFFRFPSECVKLLGELLHEQLCLLAADPRPVKLLLRDICRWIKLAHLNANGVYTTLATNGTLPDSLELHELAQALLVDRLSGTGGELLQSRLADVAFRQAYVDNMIGVVCELQMLSVVRPSVREAFRDRADPARREYNEPLKAHYNTVRQIRYFSCKWLKTVYRLVDSQLSADQMTHYLRQVLFLHVTRNNDFSYCVDDSGYVIGDIWNNETDKMLLVRGLTEVPLSDKLLTALLNLAFEKQLCLRPSEVVNMVAELVVRAGASASGTGTGGDIVPLLLVKSEPIINNMFACCSYDIALDDATAPATAAEQAQIARTLAYKSSFWKVCQALVVMASFCTATCGAYLWNNFPTVKNLLQIVITNNFDELHTDKEAMETERQFCETDAKKICELETSLLAMHAHGTDDISMAPIDAGNSKLVNLLLFNLPQGPVRQPPPSIVESLKSINAIVKIGDRLSQCRNPDFLFEIVREQDQSKVSSRKWIIDLVKKTSEQNLDGLPLLCLTEFIYHDLYEKMAATVTSGATTTSGGNVQIVSKTDTKDASLKRLVLKIRHILCGPESDPNARQTSADKDNLKNIVGALSNSFFNRLSYSSGFVRKVARECLYILLQPVASPIKLMDTSAQFVDTLKSIMNLNILQDNALICSVAEALRETLKFETDIDVIYSYVNLFALMSSGNHKEWLANTVETLSILILNRPIIADKLRSRDYETLSKITKPTQSTPLICDALAEIFLAHINYTAYQAQVVPLEHRDEAVMVNLKEKQFPVVVKVIQSQLSLVCWGFAKSKKCKKLIDFWFSKSGSKYQLPTFTSIEQPHSALPEIVPEWLVDASVHSGTVPVMLGILHHRLRHSKQISHALTPALAFTAADFIKAYLNAMNGIVKSDKPLIDSWLADNRTIAGKIATMLATVTKMHSKVKGVDTLFKSTLESVDSVPQRKPPNLHAPSVIIVKSLRPPTAESPIIVDDGDQPMEEPDESAWSRVILGGGGGGYSGGSTHDGSSATSVLAIEHLIRLLKDPKTHSETLRVLNKADYRLMPLLAVTFRSSDQASFEMAMQSFRYVFNAYPHIEKSRLWKVVYNLSLAQAKAFSDSSAMDHGAPKRSICAPAPAAVPSSSLTVKSLAKSIFNCCSSEDAAKIGPKIDQLTILGLGNGPFSESHFDIVHKLLFSSHSVSSSSSSSSQHHAQLQQHQQFSDYFMSDLLHQSSVSSLRLILHSVLAPRRPQSMLSQMNASRVLDFIAACVRHPRLQYAVALPTANRHIWPQQNAEIDISEPELVQLLQLVVSEAEHLIEQNGPSAPIVDRYLAKRSRLVDICSCSQSMLPRRAAIIQRFVESKSHNFAVEKFSFALYTRLPGLLSPLLGANFSLATVDNADNIDIRCCYSVKDVHRIGQRLLAGLVSPRVDLQDLASQSCKALVSRHPKLCVQLLPYMCALSDGALDGTDSWMDFRRKRGQALYSNLLHLLELMIPFSLAAEPLVRRNTKKILDNFLRVLIRYRDQHVFFVGFATRLVAFLEKIVPWRRTDEKESESDDDCGSGGCDFVTEHSSEITALSKVFPQFRNLVVLARSNALEPPLLAGGESPDDNTNSVNNSRASQMPLLKLEYLVNFRRKIRDTSTGNGVLVLIRDLDDISKRETNIIGLFLDDLRSLISHSMNDVRIAAVQILARYLNAFPEQAGRIVEDCIVSNMLKSNWYWSRPFANLALKTLCQTGMLAPNVVPSCLANHARLLVAGNNGRGNFRDSVELLEVIIDNVSLESFMESVASYTCKPVLKKEVVNGAGHKRHYQESADGESHKAKRSRFK